MAAGQGLHEAGSALVMGERALFNAGDLAAARPWFESAARAALCVGDAPVLARATLGLGGLWVHEHRTAVEAARVEAWQRHALALLDPGSPLARRLAVRMTAEADYRRGTSAAVLALVERARAGSDPIVLADALSLAHHCLLGPEHAALRLALSQELLAVAALTGRTVDERLGLLWRTVDLVLAGDRHAERCLRELRAATDRHPFRAVEFVLSAIDVMLAIRRGNLAAAERQAAACADHGRAVGDADAMGWQAAQLVAIRWFEGRLGEVVPLLDEVVYSPTLAAPGDALFAALAVAAASTGQRLAAVVALRRLTRDGLDRLSSSSTWLACLMGVIEAASLLGEVDTAAEAYALLAPYACLPIMASLGVVCFGSAHYPLGVAALAMGDRERAVEHLQAAVVANEALGHRPALVMSRRRLDEVLRRRDHPDGGRGPTRVVCLREGQSWRLELAGRVALVRDSVGMQYLATLLSRPGQEIPVADLVGLPAAPCTGQPLLDEPARWAYAERARVLRTEIDDAAQRGDAEQRTRANQELEWVLSELAHATGLRGRPRRFVDADERARTSVQKAIRRAVQAIRAADPLIGREVASAVVTGARCCYQPRGRA